MASSKFQGRVRIVQFDKGFHGEKRQIEESERLIHRVTGTHPSMIMGGVYFPLVTMEWFWVAYRGERWPVFQEHGEEIWRLLLPDIRIMAQRAEQLAQDKAARKKS